jgi:penicillin-binding protein 1A
VLLENVSLADLADDAPAQPGPAKALPDVASGAAAEAPTVLPPAEAYLMTNLLRAAVEESYGTAHKARALGRVVAGKTGTTNDQKDAWFIGFSPDVVAGVWVGHDAKEVLGKKETGGRAALPIWMEYMESALAGYAARDFPVPEGIVFARVDRSTGRMAGGESVSTLFQPFREGTEPSESGGPEPGSTDSYDLLRQEAF